MERDDKLQAIQSRRESLEHQKYGAELDIALAKESRDENAVKRPAELLEEVEAKLKVLDDLEAGLGDAEPEEAPED